MGNLPPSPGQPRSPACPKPPAQRALIPRSCPFVWESSEGAEPPLGPRRVGRTRRQTAPQTQPNWPGWMAAQAHPQAPVPCPSFPLQITHGTSTTTNFAKIDKEISQAKPLPSKLKIRARRFLSWSTHREKSTNMAHFPCASPL